MFTVVATVLLLALVVAVATRGTTPQPTSTWLTGMSDGQFDGPTAFASWPVGHADCFSFARGLLCATPQRLSLASSTSSTRAASGNTVAATFLLANSGTRSFDVRITQTNTEVRYVFAEPGSSRTLVLGARPNPRPTGCDGRGQGLVVLAAHSQRQLCLAFAIPHGLRATYGPNDWTQLLLGGIAQWANGEYPLPSESPGEPLVYQLDDPDTDFSTAVLTHDEANLQCQYVMVGAPGPCGPAGSPAEAVFTNLDGTNLNYGHGLIPLTTGPRALACETANESRFPCYYDAPAPSDGPIVMLLTFANPQSRPWRIDFHNVVADTQEQCTPTGCATARLVPTYPTSTYTVPHCAGAPRGLLPAGSPSRPGTVTFCIQFATNPGAVVYRLAYRITGNRPGGSTPIASFAYLGYTPPGPF